MVRARFDGDWRSGCRVTRMRGKHTCVNIPGVLDDVCGLNLLKEGEETPERFRKKDEEEKEKVEKTAAVAPASTPASTPASSDEKAEDSDIKTVEEKKVVSFIIELHHLIHAFVIALCVVHFFTLVCVHRKERRKRNHLHAPRRRGRSHVVMLEKNLNRNMLLTRAPFLMRVKNKQLMRRCAREKQALRTNRRRRRRNGATNIAKRSLVKKDAIVGNV